MEIQLLCPENLDLAELVKRVPLKKGEGMKKDSLSFIIHLIMRERAYKSEDQLRKKGKYDGFVPLQSKWLKVMVPEYTKHLKYLIDAGVVECDQKYRKDYYSKGYKIASRFITSNFKYVSIHDFVLCKKISKRRQFETLEAKVRAQYPYLLKWFDDKKLKIDYAACMIWVDEKEKFLQQGLKKIAVRLRKNKNEQNMLTILGFRIQIDRFYKQDFFYPVDKTGLRLHTNLTNLPSDLRKFVTYDGQPLVAMDIKNSQPYMALPLLNKEFWELNQFPSKKPTIRTVKMENFFLGFGSVVSSTGKGIGVGLGKSLSDVINMYPDCSETLAHGQFKGKNFTELVLNGEIYDYWAEVLEKAKLINPILTGKSKRDRAKKIIFMFLFSNEAESYNMDYASPYQLFKRTFPYVANIFTKIKESDYRNLAIILQRIESYVVLDIICKRISQERPDLPIFTIHDSIATTKGNEDYVAAIMKEELKACIGAPPTLKAEYWEADKENNCPASCTDSDTIFSESDSAQ